jgi:SAM-dependent methyltransferase
MPLSERTIAMLRCPVCSGPVSAAEASFRCASVACVASAPVVVGQSALASLGGFNSSDADEAAAFAEKGTARRSLGTRVRSVTPSLSDGEEWFLASMQRLITELKLPESGRAATIICLGSAADAKTIRSLGAGSRIEVVHLEVCGRTAVDISCDPGRLPLCDGVADAVVVRRRLHRSLHAPALAREAVRVLRTGGVIYAEEPFAIGVQHGPDDFYRYTHLGLRGQFLECEELASGVAEGVGVAMASAWRQVLWSLARSPYIGFVLATIASFTSFFWKYLDRIIRSRPRAIDGAASVYFLGRKNVTDLSERELVAGYRGAARTLATTHSGMRPPSEVFTEWAATDRDLGMAKGHGAAVEEMLTAARAALGTERNFTAIDAGCGNGWIVRRLRQSPQCLAVMGVDGAAGMIAKARALDPQGTYVNADLTTWDPPEAVDVVVSMEVLYYVDDPAALLKRIATRWLKPGGYAVIGIDHYEENVTSLGWPAYVGTHMTTWPEGRWLCALENAGLKLVRAWRAAPGREWAGTLAMLAQAQPQ